MAPPFCINSRFGSIQRMSEQPTADSTVDKRIDQEPLCHICGRDQPSLHPISDLPGELLEVLKPSVSDSDALERVCYNCIKLFQRAQEQLRQRPDVFTDAAQAL